MKIKSWAIKKVAMSDIRPMPGNPRVISDGALAALEASIARFGYVEPIVWNEKTGHIVGGHQRYSVLLERGVDEASVVAVEFDDTDEMVANMSLNNPKIEGTWDEPILSLLDHLMETDDVLFKALRMDKLRAALDKRENHEEDDSPKGVDVGGDESEPDFDTECPCCGHRWNVEAKDVVVE